MYGNDIYRARTVDDNALMFPTTPTTSQTLALDDLIARLAAHAAVDGVVVMDSAGDRAFNSTSDYDLYDVLFILYSRFSKM